MKPEDLRGYFRLWHFSATHDRLVVEVRSSGATQLYLQFLLCSRIQVPTHWQSTQPVVETEGELLRYRDNGVEILCREIAISTSANLW
jgi:hypothetical protein